MLEILDRQDVLDLHRIIMERVPANDDLKTLVESSKVSINMFVEKRYPLTKEILQKMLSSRLEAETKSTLALDLIKFIKLQIEEKRARIYAKKEAHVNFLTDPSDGRSTLRLADVLVFGWVEGKHVCVNLTRVFPLMGLRSHGFTEGQATLKPTSCKVTKHEKACIENQHVFIPFEFETFSFLSPEAIELLSRVQQVMHDNVMTPRSTNVVFNLLALQFNKG
uniref:Auxilin-like protein n=1 Tax=Tanacetum cinerariifolium TaxID=118510 RepID=A0A699H1D8_TANCI|nr:auxilin-like protein [Tanacetum cinerariifolium]